MNKYGYLEGYVFKTADGEIAEGLRNAAGESKGKRPSRLIPYLANMVPGGSSLYGATGEKGGVGRAIKTGIGSTFAGTAGVLTGILAAMVLATVRKNPTALLLGHPLGSLGYVLGGGEATHRLGRTKEGK